MVIPLRAENRDVLELILEQGVSETPIEPLIPVGQRLFVREEVYKDKSGRVLHPICHGIDLFQVSVDFSTGMSLDGYPMLENEDRLLVLGEFLTGLEEMRVINIFSNFDLLQIDEEGFDPRVSTYGVFDYLRLLDYAVQARDAHLERIAARLEED